MIYFSAERNGNEKEVARRKWLFAMDTNRMLTNYFCSWFLQWCFIRFTHQNHKILNLKFQTIILDEEVFTFMNATNSNVLA